MRCRTFLAFSVACFLHLISIIPVFSQEPANSTVTDFTSLQQAFKAPPKRFGSAPLWVWNKDVDSASITSMLQEFKNNAFGGVFIHPRAGLITPYLSKEWLSLYAYAVKEAKRLGLDVWIYDENSYPSGFAGGHVPDVMPESFNQGQMLEPVQASIFPEDVTAFFICLRKEGDHFVDITADASKEKGKTGDYFLFKKTMYYHSPWYGGFSYVDLMVKGVTETFIRETMTGYEKTIGKEFGTTVPGIFSDEPNIEVQYPGSIRWTPDLFAVFFEKWKYHLESNLPSLVTETGDWKKVRHNYYQTLLQLFIDRWSKPYAAYTKSKNMEWTGHYWEHEWPNINHGPDNMAMYAWPQRPGIDMLFNQFDENNTNAQFGNIRSVKELASVANQLDKKRTLSETYGGGGWELTFKDMKRLGDWEFALGINTLNQHLSFMSIRGARKYDYPQSFSYHEPWWPYYRSLNTYFSRLALSLSAGAQVNNTLIVEPTTTVWMYYKNGIDDVGKKVKEIGDQFQQCITRLEKSQVEYDLGSEDIIMRSGKVSDGKFIIGSRDYTTVVLPPGMENADEYTFTLLKQFVAAGGHLIQFGALQTINGSKSAAIDSFYRTNASIVTVDSLSTAFIQQLRVAQTYQVNPDPHAAGDPYHYVRKLKDGDLLFLSNASMDQPARGSISLREKNVLFMDLMTGETSSIALNTSGSEGMLRYDIPPAGSQLYFFSPEKKSGFPAYAAADTNGKKIITPTGIKRMSDNVLTIDFCDVAIGDTVLRDKHVFDAADTVFKYYGFAEGNPWNTSIQYKDRTIARDTFSSKTGFTATYYFSVKENSNLSQLKAVVESPKYYQVAVNGHRVTPQAGQWWLDKDFGVFAIGQFVHKGANKIELKAKPMRVYAEIEPVYLLGNFGLSSAAKGWDIVNPKPLTLGSWKEQGLPMFGDKVAYTKNMLIHKNANARYLLQLGAWKGTVATVMVNNQFAGIIAFDPNTCNLTPFLKEGNNTVVVTVAGSLKNVLGPHHNQHPAGMVSPWHWRYVKNHPPGNAYELYDYGLMEDFRIIQQ